MKAIIVLCILSVSSLLMARSDPNVIYIRDFDKNYDKALREKIVIIITKMNDVIDAMDGLAEQDDQKTLREVFIRKYSSVVEKDPLISEFRDSIDEVLDDRVKDNLIKYEQVINNEKKVLR